MGSKYTPTLTPTIRELWKWKLHLALWDRVRRSASYRDAKAKSGENAWTLLRELGKTRQAMGLDGKNRRSEQLITEGEGQTLYRLVSERKPAFALEIGFRHGYSTLHVLQGLADAGSGRLLSLDPFQYDPDVEGVGLMNVRRAGLEKYHLFCEGASQFILPFLCERSFAVDFAFIDASHLFDFTLLEFFYVDKMIAPGSPIVFHDYLNPSVYTALQFIEANRSYEVLSSPEKNLRILLKKGPDTRPWYYFVPFKVPQMAWTSLEGRRPVEPPQEPVTGRRHYELAGPQFAPGDSTPKTISQLTRLLDQVEGFIAPEAMAMWDILLDFQSADKITGGILEIGVYHGKSALLLGLHSAKKEPLFLVDLQDWGAKENVRRLTGKDAQYIVSNSSLIGEHPEITSLAGKLRWIHIDGDHTSQGVRADLENCNRLLSDDGVICLDDFLNTSFPQVSAVTFEFLKDHPDELKLFLCGYGKGYLCRPRKQHDYIEFLKANLVRELKDREVQNFTVYKTDDPKVFNCIGVGHRYFDQDLFGWSGNRNMLP
jgi:predicted O-methyltransferase YrrM